MQFNLTRHFSLSVDDITEGNVSLNYKQLEALVNYSVEPITVLSGGDVLCLEFDLNYRTKIDEVRYYFNSNTSSGTVASGIVFQYINETYENYMNSPTLIGNGYYYTTISGASSPRKLKFKHTLAPNISGTLHYFAVYNDDTIIDYGPHGNQTELDAIASKGLPQVYYVPIYNSGNTVADSYSRLEPSYTNVDEVVYLSASDSGPWVGLRDGGYEIAGKDSWDLGARGANVIIKNDMLTFQHDTQDPLVGEALAFNIAYGVYTTKMFSPRAKEYEYNKLLIYNSSSLHNSLIKVDQADTSETIDLKESSDVLLYEVYRSIYTYSYSSSYRVGYRDRMINTDDLVKEANYIFGYSSSVGVMKHYMYKLHKDTGKSFGVLVASKGAYIFSLEYADTTADYRQIVYTTSYSDYLNIKKVEIDKDGGGWIWIYSRYGVNGTDIDKAGDYLIYYTSGSSSPVFTLFHQTQVVGGFSIEHATGYIWYTDVVNRLLIKGSATGSVFVSVQLEDFRILGSCASVVDGGCWLVNDHQDGFFSFYKFDSNGVMVNRLDNFLEADSVSFIVMDVDEDIEAFWVVSEDKVIYVIVEEGVSLARQVFQVPIITINDLTSVDNGCWCSSADGNTYFIDKHLGRITKTINLGSKSHIRVPYFVYTKPDEGVVWDSQYPLAIDQSWQSLGYKKTNNEFLYLRNSNYYKAELTMWPNRPSDLYSNASLQEDWSPIDYFNTSLDNRPVGHRWNYYDDRVVIENNKLVFKGHGLPTSSSPIYVDSFKKWYLKKDSDDDFNAFEIHYEVPDVTISGAVHIMFEVNPSDVANSKEQYYKAHVIREESQITLHLEVYGHPSHYSDTSREYIHYSETFSFSGISGSGIIEFNRYNNSRKIKLRHYDGSTWIEITCNAYAGTNSTYYIDFNGIRSLNSTIYVDSPRDVYVIKFLVNEPLSNFYWYYTPPMIKSIYCQPFVKVAGILPNDNKNIYVKIDVPDDEEFVVNDSYDINLLTWWRTKV